MNPFPKVPQKPTSQQQQLMQLLQSNPQLMQKYQQQISKMQSQSKNSHPPMTSQQYIQKLTSIQKYLDPQGGLLIQPSSAFVLKFLQKRTKQKIFVNVVTHQVIDHPQQKLLVDFQNQPGLRIPMSMGRIRQDHDKNGNICKVVDVVMNPKIVQTANTQNDILGFMGQIIGNYLLQKYKIAVQDQILKKVKGLKYKGNKVQIQRVKGKKAPKIQQISEQQIKQQKQKQKTLLTQINQETMKPQIMRPQFQIFSYNIQQKKYQLYSLEIGNFSHLKIIISLPHLIHSKGIHLQGSDKMIYLSVKNLYELCLKIPYQVGKFKAAFGRKQRKLRVFVYRQEQDKQNKQKQVLPVQNQEKKQSNTNVSNAAKINIETDLLYDLV